MKVAIALCIGGNDFLPKYHGISHEKVLDIFLATQQIRSNLLNFSSDKISLAKDEYINLVKCLYVPKKSDPLKMTYDEIRQKSIQANKKTPMQQVRNPQLWMPPVTASEKMAALLELQIERMSLYVLAYGYVAYQITYLSIYQAVSFYL